MTSIPNNSTWLEESPIAVVEGEVLGYNVVYDGTLSLASSFMKIWKNGSEDKSGTMLTGALAVNGNILTLMVISFAGAGDNDYIMEVGITENGNLRVDKCKFMCSQGKNDL